MRRKLYHPRKRSLIMKTQTMITILFVFSLLATATGLAYGFFFREPVAVVWTVIVGATVLVSLLKINSELE